MLLEQVRMEAEKAGRAKYALAFRHIIESHPLFAELQWDGIDGDQMPYQVGMGEATAAHMDPDSAYPSITEERVVDRIATVRPIYSKIDKPIVGRVFGTPSERLVWHTDAIVKKFMSSFVTGRYVTTATIAGLTTASLTFVQAGPHWDMASRGRGRGGGVLKIRKDGTDFYVSFKAYFDTAFGTELGPYTAAVATVNITLQSSNPYYWVTLTLDKNALPSATDTGTIEFTSTTYGFDGVKALVDPTLDDTSIAAAGEDVGFEHLDLIDDAIKTQGRVIVLAHGTTFNSLRAEARTVPGISLSEVQGVAMDAAFRYGRITVIKESNIPHNITYKSTTTNTTYLIGLSPNLGVRGVFSRGESGMVDGRLMGGLRIADPMELEGSDHDRLKLAAYWSIWNPTRQGLFILNGIKN